MDNLLLKLAFKIKEQRKIKNLTQIDLAEQSGLARTTVARLERMGGSTDLNVLLRLSKTLDSPLMFGDLNLTELFDKE